MITSLTADLKLPAVAAPMFLISGPDLVVSCCCSGIIGSFPALNQRSSEGFEQWLLEIRQRLDAYEKDSGQQAAPFAVNLIVHQSNPRLEADLALCVKHKVPLIITSLGINQDVIDAIQAYGGKVIHDVINRRHAEKAAGANVDGLILVSAGAGGHGGTLNPMAFVSEVRQFFDKTILLSGCISTGRDIASAMQMGADLAYIGTRFINTRESLAPDDYHDMINDSQAGDIVYTSAISGINANFLRSSLEANGITPEMWSHKGKVDFGEEMNEAKAWKTMWSAGQGVTSIHDVLPTRELVARLRVEFQQAIEAQNTLLQKFPGTP